MSSGAASILQLSSPQDDAIRGPPTFTLWKKKYYAYANYIFHTQQLSSTGTSTVQSASLPCRIKVDGAGDLAGPAFLRVILPPISALNPVGQALTAAADFFYYVNCVGYAMIQEVGWWVGSQKQISHSGRFMDFLDELTANPATRLDECVGRFQKEVQLITAAQYQQVLLIPLQFTHCGKPEAYFPIIALQLHDAEYRVTFRDPGFWTVNRGDDSYTFNTTFHRQLQNNTNVSILQEFVYIDYAQRVQFCTNSHSYIITQVQEETQSVPAGNGTTWVRQRCNVVFNHMAKCIGWAAQQAASMDGVTYTKQSVGVKDPFDYCSSNGGEAVIGADFAVNNASIWESNYLPAMYFRTIQPARSWKAVPKRLIYCYCFGHETAENQIYASAQLSRADGQQFNFYTRDSAAHNIWIWVLNSNICVVNGGMAGVPFNS